jgi:phage pi2 protein 07
MRSNFKLKKRDTDEMFAIVDELERVLHQHRRLPSIMVLSRLLPSVWCSITGFQTATEALDNWRILNSEMENFIKENFGKLRYDFADRDSLQ